MKRTLMVFIGIFFLFLIVFNQKGIGGTYLKNSLDDGLHSYKFYNLDTFQVKQQLYDYVIMRKIHHEDYGYGVEPDQFFCRIEVHKVQHSLPKSPDLATELNRQGIFEREMFKTIFKQQPKMDLILNFNTDNNQNLLWGIETTWLNIKYLKLLLSDSDVIIGGLTKLMDKPVSESKSSHYFTYKFSHTAITSSISLNDAPLSDCLIGNHSDVIPTLHLLIEKEYVIFPYSKNEMKEIVAKTLSHPNSAIYFKADRTFYGDNNLSNKVVWIFNAEIGYLVKIVI